MHFKKDFIQTTEFISKVLGGEKQSTYITEFIDRKNSFNKQYLKIKKETSFSYKQKLSNAYSDLILGYRLEQFFTGFEKVSKIISFKNKNIKKLFIKTVSPSFRDFEPTSIEFNRESQVIAVIVGDEIGKHKASVLKYKNSVLKEIDFNSTVMNAEKVSYVNGNLIIESLEEESMNQLFSVYTLSDSGFSVNYYTFNDKTYLYKEFINTFDEGCISNKYYKHCYSNLGDSDLNNIVYTLFRSNGNESYKITFDVINDFTFFIENTGTRGKFLVSLDLDKKIDKVRLYDPSEKEKVEFQFQYQYFLD